MKSFLKYELEANKRTCPAEGYVKLLVGWQNDAETEHYPNWLTNRWNQTSSNKIMSFPGAKDLAAIVFFLIYDKKTRKTWW